MSSSAKPIALGMMLSEMTPNLFLGFGQPQANPKGGRIKLDLAMIPNKEIT